MNIIHNNFDINGPCIYRILNSVDGKFYIGSTDKGNRRYAQHFHDLQANKHDNKRLQNAFNKYSVNVFIFEILEPLDSNDKSKLVSLEQVYIDWFNVSRTGYNISGIASRPEMHEETRAKISATKQEKGFRNQIEGVRAYKAANPEKAAASIRKAMEASADKSRLIDEHTLVSIIKDYIEETPSIIVLAKKYGMCYSTLAKIFKRTSINSKYTNFLAKIGFEGSSIKDLRKPEIQAKLKLTQD